MLPILIFNGKSRALLALDDLMTSTDDRVVDLFTKISYHRNLSIVYLILLKIYFTKACNRER